MKHVSSELWCLAWGWHGVCDSCIQVGNRWNNPTDLMKHTTFNTPGSHFAWLAVMAVSTAFLTATPEMGPEGDGEISEFVAMDVRADSQMVDSTVNVSIFNGIAILEG